MKSKKWWYEIVTLFYYYGRDLNGNAIRGEVEKATTPEVVSYLSQKNIIPIDIKPLESKDIDSFFVFFKKKSFDNEKLILLSKQLYTICQTRLPLSQGLESLINGTVNPYEKLILTEISDKIKSGWSLSQAMQLHSKLFSPFMIGMIAVGESTGNLAQAFHQISDHLERDLLIKNNIKAAIRYPTFVLLSIVIALIVVNYFVVPAFGDLFHQFNINLPLTTQFLLAISDFFTQYSVLILLSIVLAWFLLGYYYQSTSGRLLLDEWQYYLPVLGAILYKGGLARYAHSLSLLLEARVPVSQAITLAASVVGNRYLSNTINRIKNYIEYGDSVYQAHSKSRIFSPLVLQMLYLGEETASLDQLLDEVSQSYQRETDYDIQRLGAIIEPILILVLAAFIGLMALGIFLPLWSLFDTV